MSSASNEKLLNNHFLLITALGFIYFFIFHSFLLLPLHLVKLGATEKTVGFIMGIAGLSTLFVTPSVGSLADKYGKKIFVSSGILILTASTLGFIFLKEINIFYYILRIFHGLSFSLFFIAAGAYTTEVSPENKKTQAIGIYGVFTILNYAIAPYFGRIIIELYDFNRFIILISVFGLVGFCISLFLKETKVISNMRKNKRNYSYFQCLNNKGVVISSLTLFFMGAAFITTLSFISIYCVSIGIENFQFYFISYTLAVLVIRIFLGWLPDKYGKGLITMPSVFIFALSLLLLYFLKDIKLLVIAGILFGLGHGFAYPSIYSIIIENNPQEARAKSFAISSLAFTSGGMFGSIIFGLIADYYNMHFMFLLISITVFAIFLLLILNKNNLDASHRTL